MIAMVIEVTECNYKGFRLELVKGKGWKIILGEDEYLFPHCQAAETAIDEFCRDVIKKHGGKKLKNKQ